MTINSSSSLDEDVRAYINSNRHVIGDILRYSQDPYSRACALVLLQRGGTERDIDAIQADLDRALTLVD